MEKRKSLREAIERRLIAGLAKGALSDTILRELWAILDLAHEDSREALDLALDALRRAYRRLRARRRDRGRGRIAAQLEQLVGRYAIHHNLRGARERVIQINHELRKGVHVRFEESMGERITKIAPRRDTPPPAGTQKLSAVAPPRRVFR